MEEAIPVFTNLEPSKSSFGSKVSSFFSSIFKKSDTKIKSVRLPKETGLDSEIPKAIRSKADGILYTVGNKNTTESISSIIGGVSAIADTVFGFLGQSEQTKRSKYELEALTKQKELSLLGGQIEYNLAQLDSDLELKKQELVLAQKADTTKTLSK